MKTMLDSGAFTAWTKWIEIDVRAYIRFIKRYGSYFDVITNLDVIPGICGQREYCPEAIEHAAAKSYENLQRMRDAGIDAIPVFHQGEELRWLERMLDDKEPRIGLSAWKRQYRADIIGAFDNCFDMIAKRGHPLVKCHGFGMTSVLGCHRYPWATCDSTRWTQAAGWGQVPLPVYSNGRPDYTVQPMTVSLTDGSRHQSVHFATLDDCERDCLHRFLNEEVGITIEQARLPGYRPRAWITLFLGVQRSCSVQQGSALLHHPAHKYRPTDWTFEIAFARSASKREHEYLVQCGADRHLFSFYLFKDMDEAKVEAFLSQE